MLKKYLVAALLTVAVSAVYADAPVMVPVRGDLYNQHFSLSPALWGWQFNNKTGGKTLVLTVTVAADAKNPTKMECWLSPEKVEETKLNPGSTGVCVTSNVIRLVTEDKHYLPSAGDYTIVVTGNNGK